MSGDSKVIPSRQGTHTSNFSDDAIPETDPNTTSGTLAERAQAWKHAVVYLEEYVGAVQRVHKESAKEYERVLKTISKPLREGEHFDQAVGGVAGFFETMRVNTEKLINTNLATETKITSVLNILGGLHKKIKTSAKQLSHGAQKSAKEIEKARNTTQKHIELLGQQSASFESAGGKISSHDDPYVVHRGVLHRLNKQVMEENNHRADLIHIQNNFQASEAEWIGAMQTAMTELNELVGEQAHTTAALHGDNLIAAKQITPDFEWKYFTTSRHGQALVNPNDPPRSVESLSFPNMTHPSTKPLIEGSLERKSRNKLSWGYQTGYYVVTPSRWLHEFKDSDNIRKDPTPELSIYLPDAVVGAPNMDKFNIKGKDKSKGFSSKLVGSSELALKAHTAMDAERWFTIIKDVAGATGPAATNSTPTSPVSPTHASSFKSVDEHTAADHKAQEAGITGQDTVPSPTALSPVSTEKSSLPASNTVSRSASVSSPLATSADSKHPAPAL